MSRHVPPFLASRLSSSKQSCRVRLAFSRLGSVLWASFSYVPPMMTLPPVPGRGMMYGGGGGAADPSVCRRWYDRCP